MNSHRQNTVKHRVVKPLNFVYRTLGTSSNKEIFMASLKIVNCTP